MLLFLELFVDVRRLTIEIGLIVVIVEDGVHFEVFIFNQLNIYVGLGMFGQIGESFFHDFLGG